MFFLYKKIREERIKKNITLKELSKKSRVSQGLLSSIERGIVNPSIDVVIKICKALNIHPNHIIKIGKTNGEIAILRRKDQFGIKEKKSESYIVSPIGLQKNKNIILLTYLNQNEEFGRKHISYNTSELIFVINGKIKLYYGDNEYTLKEGDSAYFSANKIHYVKNLYKGKSVLIWSVYEK